MPQNVGKQFDKHNVKTIIKYKIMDFKEELFNKRISDTVNCFTEKITKIYNDNIEYFKENDIDLVKCVVPIYDKFSFNYLISCDVSDHFKEEIDKSFKECFSKYS